MEDLKSNPTSPFNVENVYDKYIDKFNDKAKLALSVKVHQTIYEYDDQNGVRQFAKPKFIGARVKKESIEDAVDLLVDKINTMASNGFIMATLSPLIVVEVAVDSNQLNLASSTEDSEDDTCYAVMSYIFLTEDGRQWLESNVPHLDMKESKTLKGLMS